MPQVAKDSGSDTRAPAPPAPPRPLLTRPTIVFAANEAWYLLNFQGALTRALIADGYRLVAAANPDPVHAQQLEALGCRFRAVAIDNKGLSPVRDLATMRAFGRLFREERADLFLGATIKPNIYGSLAARRAGVKSISTVSGLGTTFIRETWVTRVVETLYRRALRGASAIFFQNESDRAIFVDRRLVTAAQTRLVPGSGINLERFAPRRRERTRDDPVTFLLIARLLRDKGVLEYVEAARMLRGEGRNVRFQILGFLNAENRTAIGADEVAQWVGEGAIEYLEPTADVRPFIAAADCIVLPSYREGTSRVLLEAAAMARPVVATDVPGCREVVDSDVNGFLCAPRDAQSLAAALARMADLPDERRESMGRAGRDKVVREFDVAIVIERYRRAIGEALGAQAMRG